VRTAQVAGGVPAMCDGVTQGTPGMELSLFSRDTIAMATAISLSHDVFDCALMLGVCDKIVPGLLIGALHFGHLPTVFVPAGPMTSGLSNNDKAKVREKAGKAWSGAASCWRPSRPPTTAWAPAPFTARPTATRCCSKPWACMCPARPLSTPERTRDELTREAVRTVLGITKAKRFARRLARWWTNAASSTPWWPCWPPAAPPTT
jgi:phosphogluconate dehydratase